MLPRSVTCGHKRSEPDRQSSAYPSAPDFGPSTAPEERARLQAEHRATTERRRGLMEAWEAAEGELKDVQAD